MGIEPIPVLVTAIGGGGHGEQIVKALRLAGPGRYRIVGGDASHFCPQFGLVDEQVLLPKASAPDYIDAILAVCRHFGVRAIFHGCEPELLAFHSNRHRFAEAGIFLPINPPSVIDTCMDKFTTAQFLEANGFKPPWTKAFEGVHSTEQVPMYPVIVKPMRGGGGSRDCFIAQNKRQLEILAEYLNVAKEPFLLQEYVGTHENEFTVGVLRDMDGRFINSIALRRLLNSALNIRLAVRNTTGRCELGEWLVVSTGVSHGRIDDFPEIRAACERIADALDARGAINIQCRVVNGEVRVFEINPRFSGTTSLRAMVGYNEPDILIRRHLLSETITPRFKYRQGWILRSLMETVLAETPVPAWNDITTTL